MGQQIVVGVGMGAEFAEPARTIIGVVGDTHNVGLGNPPDPMMMVPTAAGGGLVCRSVCRYFSSALGNANPQRSAFVHYCRERTIYASSAMDFR